MLDPVVAVADLDTRLAGLVLQIDSTRKEHRSKALPAAFNASVAAERARLGAELDALTRKQAELTEAREVAAQQIDENQRAEAIAAEHARRLGQHRAQCDHNANARNAVRAMHESALAFAKAAVELHAELRFLSNAAGELTSMLHRRLIRGVVNDLNYHSLPMGGCTLKDTTDHWDVGFDAAGLTLDALADPVSP